MNRKVEFVNLELFSNENIEESKKILKEIFLIDFSMPEELINYDNIDIDEDLIESNLGIKYKTLNETRIKGVETLNDVKCVGKLRILIGENRIILEAQYPIEFYEEVVDEIEFYEIKEIYKKILDEVKEKYISDKLNCWFKDRFDEEVIRKLGEDNLDIIYKKLIKKHENKIFLEEINIKRRAFLTMLDKINLNQNSNEILKSLINICHMILQNKEVYFLDFYPIDKEQLPIYVETMRFVAENIIIDNIQNNIILCEEFNELNNGNISFQEAFKKYVDFKNNYYRLNFESNDTISDEDSREKDKKNIMNELEKDIKDKLKELKNFTKNFEKIFYYKDSNDEFMIFSEISNIFLYTIDNYSSCKNYIKKVEGKNNLLTNTIKTNRKFVEMFLECKDKFNFTDIYFFERIYNNNFTLSLYNKLKINEKRCGENIGELLINLADIVYLPNNYYWSNIIDNFLILYLNEYENDIDGFKKELRRMILGFSFYIIPLYNMVFSNVLKMLCDIKKVEINEFIEKYVSENKKNIIEKNIEMLSDFIKKDSIQDNRKFDLGKFEYRVVDCIVNEKLNLEDFNMSNIIKLKNSFNMQSHKDRGKYLEIIKEFIINLICIEKIE